MQRVSQSRLLSCKSDYQRAVGFGGSVIAGETFTPLTLGKHP